MDAKLPISDKDNNDDAVLNYVQATGINLILPDNEDKAAPAPAHQDDDANSTGHEVQPTAVAPPPASCNNSLCNAPVVNILQSCCHHLPWC